MPDANLRRQELNVKFYDSPEKFAGTCTATYAARKAVKHATAILFIQVGD